MQITTLTKEKYEEWDKFCLESDDAWFWHTSKRLEYILKCKPELKTTSKSFMITHGSEIIAICPLTIELINFNGKRFKEFSFGGLPMFFPAFKNNLKRKSRKRIEEMIFKHVDELAMKNNVTRSSFRCSPLSPSFLKSAFNRNNIAMEYGYNNISLNTSIIDLTRDLEDIRESLRRNHRRAIEKASNFKVETFDKNNITKEIYRKYQIMHHKDVGYIARPQITFDSMYNWIIDGNAVLFELKNSDSIGFFYVFLYKNRAYAGSCCNEPTCTEFGVQHVLIWHTITWLIKNNFKYLELGFQKYAYTQHDFPGPKEISISLFKRGFGPDIVPLFIGEKFYSKECYVDMNNYRSSHFLKTFEAGERIKNVSSKR